MSSVIVDNSPGPKLHAFIIAVESYTFLEDGSSPGPKLPFAMGQLKAAPISAIALANWLIHDYKSQTPLGSIELLVSSPEKIELTLKDGSKTTVDGRADSRSLKPAFKSWFRRLNGTRVDGNGTEIKASAELEAQMKNNIALFYFCGHGFEKGDVHLLLEDFGEDRDLLFENSFNFNYFYSGMKQAKPTTQLYFVDSCRTVPSTATARENIEGITLLAPLITDKSQREAPILYSTLSTTTAWAPTDGSATRFTKTLIDCFRSAATKDNGIWKVTTGKLIADMKELLNSDPVNNQICISGGDRLTENSVLYTLDSPPTVRLTLSCKPMTTLPKLIFKITNSLLGTEQQRVPPAPDAWQLNVPAASYILETTFLDKSRELPREEIYVFPPKEDRTLDLS
ncbi:MAG: caspase family protein [Candidatus Melainabacteria bacterium]|nr:MAG: caspase family protein [Candidatus Melainabacteria bacterium]